MQERSTEDQADNATIAAHNRLVGELNTLPPEQRFARMVREGLIAKGRVYAGTNAKGDIQTLSQAEFDALPALLQRAVRETKQGDALKLLDTTGMTPAEKDGRYKSLGLVDKDALYVGVNKDGEPLYVVGPDGRAVQGSAELRELVALRQRYAAAPEQGMIGAVEGVQSDTEKLAKLSTLLSAGEKAGILSPAERQVLNVQRGQTDADVIGATTGVVSIVSLPLFGALAAISGVEQARAWKSLSPAERAAAIGLDALALVPFAISRAGRGSVAVRAATSDGPEFSTLVKASGAKAEIVADSAPRYLETVKNVGQQGQGVTIIMRPTAESVKAAGLVDDALRARGAKVSAVLEIDRPLTSAHIGEVVGAAKAEGINRLTVRTVGAGMSKQASDDIATALQNAYAHHGLKLDKSEVIRPLGDTATSARGSARELRIALAKEGIETTVTREVSGGGRSTNIRTPKIVRLEPEPPGRGGGNILVRADPTTDIRTVLRGGGGGGATGKAARGVARAAVGARQAGVGLADLSGAEAIGVEAPHIPMPHTHVIPAAIPLRPGYPESPPLSKPTPTPKPTPQPKPRPKPYPGRPSIPGPTAKKGGGVKPPPVSGGDTAIPDQYPYEVQWDQGKTRILENLVTGNRLYSRNPGDPGLRPQDTFRVVSKSAQKPSIQRIDLGAVDAIVSDKGVTFERSRTVQSPREPIFRTRRGRLA
jgi:hypothetical protein